MGIEVGKCVAQSDAERIDVLEATVRDLERKVALLMAAHEEREALFDAAAVPQEWVD